MDKRMADVLGTMPMWTLDSQRPRLVAPSGREYRMSPTREIALHVPRAVMRTIDGGTDDTGARVRATPIHEFFQLVLRWSVESEADEPTVAASLAQFLDVLIWQIEWSDLPSEVARA